MAKIDIAQWNGVPFYLQMQNSGRRLLMEKVAKVENRRMRELMDAQADAGTMARKDGANPGGTTYRAAQVFESLQSGCKTAPEVADDLGMTREHVYRVLRRLVAKGFATSDKKPRIMEFFAKPGTTAEQVAATAQGAAKKRILDYLAAHPWSTVDEIYKATGAGQTYVQTVVRKGFDGGTLLRRGENTTNDLFRYAMVQQ